MNITEIKIQAKIRAMRVAHKACNYCLVGVLQEEIKLLKEMGSK